MFAMVHVTEVVLLAFEKDNSKPVKCQRAANIVVEHSSTKVEPLVVLTSLSKLALLFGKLAHLKVNMRLLHEVSLLNAGFGLHYQVLRRLSHLMRHGARSGTQWNSRRVVVLCMVAQTNVAKGVLDYRLEDVGWLHPDLLREAPLVGPTRRAHVELVDHHFKEIKLFVAKVTKQLLVRLVGCVLGCVLTGTDGTAEFFVDLLQKTGPSILEFDDLLCLELLHVVLVAGLLLRVVALIHHVRVVHAHGTAQHLDLV